MQTVLEVTVFTVLEVTVFTVLHPVDKPYVLMLQDELKQVKKRNKQLCVILAQGESKYR